MGVRVHRKKGQVGFEEESDCDEDSSIEMTKQTKKGKRK
jgi:hypothetical protein